jgi:predicted glycogen debranching enzyme
VEENMSSSGIHFDQQVCSRLDLALSREWLETNGLGGFASSTIVGLNTRRYHGLLTAATTPPAGRVVLLSKLEETLVVGEQRFDLSANEYPGAVHPQGHTLMKEFRLDPFPTFVYSAAGLEVEKRLFMVHGEDTTVIEYDVRTVNGEAVPECTLEVRPLIAFRDYHSTTHQNDALNPSLEQKSGMVSLRPYEGLPRLYVAHNADEVKSESAWYRNFEYRVERERGLNFQEDLYQPFVLRFQLKRRTSAAVIVSTEPRDATQSSRMRAREMQRREKIAETATASQPFVQALAKAADQFIVERGSGKTIIAGYHWFTDWGRDTMIALPGLTLVTGRFDVARQILETFADHVNQGMLPNRFPDSGETQEYNTVDATLWFFEAIRAYLQYTGDEQFVREALHLKLKDIIDWHVRGTRYGIHVDTDGLLACGEPGVQLTWMDVKIGDWVVTPRAGKPVEIQALWYNALRVMEDLARRFGERAQEEFFASLASKARESFNATFWNSDRGCLYDVAGPNDDSLRPNQILAVSLPHGMLSPERARAVVEIVQAELLTPMGLRTLSRHDPRYRAHYGGGVRERDSAYHLGTVWPWLMGPFLTAYMKVHDHSAEAVTQAEQWLSHFEQHFQEAGLGSIAEIADAEYPHTPRGCMAQAWSVAELLRAAVEDVYGIKPAGLGQKKNRASKAVAAPVRART